MRHRSYIMIALMLVLSGVTSIIPNGDHYVGALVPTRGMELTMDMNVSTASFASFSGEIEFDNSGESVSIVGDVNGDGFDDIIISSNFNDEGGVSAGQTYLVFGKTIDWTMDVNLTMADASFLGETDFESSGLYVSGAGDVNKDGYDDFLIGATQSKYQGESRGQVYLIFGKASGWTMDTDLGTSDASFVGEAEFDRAGACISGIGDVNGDGYDDFLIGANNNDAGGDNSGQIYLILGKASGWAMRTSLGSSAASFIGEEASDQSGDTLSGAGDVNGDGYDDIIIGAQWNDWGGLSAGKTYLILGKSAGWSMDRDLSTADASFIGETIEDYAGVSVAGAGDVNGDGLDDILIGSDWNDEGGFHAGQTYLIFGKTTGWTKNMNLSLSDASFIGEEVEDFAGRNVFGPGDVDGDGLDDILIGAWGSDAGGQGSGQAYLIHGKSSGWTMDIELDMADASFIGERAGDELSTSISGGGDVDGDGFDDMVIAAKNNDENGLSKGQTYLISEGGFKEPFVIYDIKVKNGLGDQIQSADIGEVVYVEVSGLDSDPNTADRSRVNITFSQSQPIMSRIALVETGENTGIYKGKFLVPNRALYLEKMTFSTYIDRSKSREIMVDYPFRPSSVGSISILESLSSSIQTSYLDYDQVGYIEANGVDTNPMTIDKAFVTLASDKNTSFKQMVILIETRQNTGVYVSSYVVPPWMEYFENITVRSTETTSVWTKFMVHTPLQLRTDSDIEHVREDEKYNAYFWNFGYETAIWSVTESAEWLEWDNSKKELNGVPDNAEVGTWSVLVRITDAKGHNDTLDFDIEVENRPPVIITQDVLTAYEDEEYYVDYNSDDDGQGEVTWYLTTNSPFLSIDKFTGVMSGKAMNDEIGTYYVTVQAQDGHKGFTAHTFNLTALNTNDRPVITTTDVRTILQDDPFIRDYEVLDQDVGDSHQWFLMSDAEWLMMNMTTGVLSGTPGPADVGIFKVNITVRDVGNLKDYREYDLEVLDRPDAPTWDEVPVDVTMMHGARYYFDVNATDYDVGNKVEYSIRSKPQSDISIDPDTGTIDWVVDIKYLTITSDSLEVTVKASDGELFATHTFHITILPTEPPVSTLISPEKGSKISITNSVLRWSGTDPEDDSLTYSIYLGLAESIVTSLREEVLLAKDLAGTEYSLTNLEAGKTYFWMIIPNDGCSDGSCSNGPFSFKVNNKPAITDIDRLSATVGDGFSVKVVCTEVDTEDSLTFTLSKSPKGMVIKSDTGYITWTPGSDQTGENRVVVNVTDGYDSSEMTFFIDVSESKGLSIGTIAGIAIGVLFVAIIMVLVYLLVVKRRSEEKSPVDESEAEEIARQIEKSQHEREWDEAHLKPGGHSNVVTTVPLSAAEAHAHDGKDKLKTYEELYGEKLSEE